METEEEREEANETAGGDVVVDYTHPPQSNGGHETFSDLMDDDIHTKEESTQSIVLVFQKINLTDKMMREREREREREKKKKKKKQQQQQRRGMEVTKNLCSFRVSSRVSNQDRDSEKPRARESKTHKDSSEKERERERHSDAARDRDQI
jgi:hypothetical protein